MGKNHANLSITLNNIVYRVNTRMQLCGVFSRCQHDIENCQTKVESDVEVS